MVVPPSGFWKYDTNAGTYANTFSTTNSNGYTLRGAIVLAGGSANLAVDAVYAQTNNIGLSPIQLSGNNAYKITFAAPTGHIPSLGTIPPLVLDQATGNPLGFWSLTVYDEKHMFNPNAIDRYSLGTKNDKLRYNTDGSLTLYAGAKSPGREKESNWLPAPNGTFSLYAAGHRDGDVNQPLVGWPVWVKMRNTLCEQMFSGSPPNSDIARCDRHRVLLCNAFITLGCTTAL